MSTGSTQPIGSTCIEETVPALIAMGADRLAANLKAAVEAHRKAIEVAKRKVRDSANADVVQVLLADRAALKSWVTAQRAAKVFVGRDLYDFAISGDAKAASTPGRTAAALRRSLTLSRTSSLLPYHVALPNVRPLGSKPSTLIH